MHLLIITRKIDAADPRVGFFTDWLKRFAQNLDRLSVITWQTSETSDLAENIKVYSLPKNKFLKIIILQKILWRLLSKVDGVFCHMNPEYTILAAPLAKIFRKKIVSWYTHGAVSWRLKIMEKFTNQILTASKESFRLPSKKLIVVGHGINTEKFNFSESKKQSGIFQILSVGRISPTKDYESMIKAMDILAQQGIIDVKLNIIGTVGLAEQQTYFNSLKEMVVKMNLTNQVEFLGAVKHNEIPNYLRTSDIFINLSGTGSLDKAILESMACGCLVLTSNIAFKNLIPNSFFIVQNQPKNLAEKIKWVKQLSSADRQEISHQLRKIVVSQHNLDNLIKKIISQFV